MYIYIRTCMHKAMYAKAHIYIYVYVYCHTYAAPPPSSMFMSMFSPEACPGQTSLAASKLLIKQASFDRNHYTNTNTNVFFTHSDIDLSTNMCTNTDTSTDMNRDMNINTTNKNANQVLLLLLKNNAYTSIAEKERYLHECVCYTNPKTFPMIFVLLVTEVRTL